VRELYERKLERANNLYLELSAVLLQVEQRENEIARSESFSTKYCARFCVLVLIASSESSVCALIVRSESSVLVLVAR